MSSRGISVIIPVRDGESTIRTAVRSTLKNIQPEDEVLVADDGSTDRTVELLRTMADPRLQVVRNDRPLGVAGSLNRLLELSEKAWVARMDADDVVLPGRFTRQMRMIERGAKLTFTSRVNFGSRPRNFRPAPLRAYDYDHLRVAMIAWNPVAHSTMLGSREVLVEAGGYRSGPAEDYEFWMRLLASGVPMSADRRPGIAYRLHDTQITRSVGWAARYATDETLSAAHDQLMASLGWRGPGCWRLLNAGEAQDPAVLNELLSFIRSLPIGSAHVRRRVARTIHRRASG